MLYKKAIGNILAPFETAADLGITGAALILACAAGAGTAAGTVAAKATEPNVASLNDIQQQYMNARLDADIKETAAKLRQEQRARQANKVSSKYSSIRF